VKGILQIDLITIKQEIPWRKWNNLDEIGQGLQWNSGFKYSGAAKYIYIAVFPHGMDVKIVAIENADWLWKTTSHSWWAKKSCL